MPKEFREIPSVDLIYDLFIDNSTITTKQIKSLGYDKCRFNDKDIKALMETGELIRVSRGIYTLGCIEFLYDYSQFLLSKDKSRARQCMQSCIQFLNEKFSVAITSQNYDEAFLIIDNFYKVGLLEEANFYLRLMSQLTNLPERYKEIVKKLNLKDVMASSATPNTEMSDENKVKALAFDGFHIEALNFLKNNGELFTEEEYNVIYDLISRIIEAERNLTFQIADMQRNGEYQALNQLLSDLSERCVLRRRDAAILKVVKEILRLKNNGTPEAPSFIRTHNYMTAIENGCYEQALSIKLKNNKEKNFNSDSDMIVGVLKDYLNTLKQAKIEKLSRESNLTDETGVEKYLQKITSLAESITYPILLKQMDKPIRKIALQQLENVEDLDVIKVGEDSKRQIAIRKISGESNHQDLLYAQKLFAKEEYRSALVLFESYLSGCQSPEDNIYYQLGMCCLKLNDYYKALTYFLIYQEVSKDKPNKFDVSSSIKLCQATINVQNIALEPEIEEYYQNIISETEINKKPIMLKAMTENQLAAAVGYFNIIPNIKTMIVDLDGVKRLIVRQCIENKDEYRTTLLKAREAFDRGNTEENIRHLENFVAICPTPNAKILNNLHKAHYLAGNYQIALMYVLMAKKTNENELQQYDYSLSIAKIKKKIEDELYYSQPNEHESYAPELKKIPATKEN